MKQIQKKYKLVKKAWEIDLSRINEGYLYCDMITYAENRNKAKLQLLKENKWESLECYDKYYNYVEVTYLNMPILRNKALDLYDFEGKELSLANIKYALDKRKRLNKLNQYLTNDKIKYCYIKKRGSFYGPNNCGYYGSRDKAGVYTIEDGVSSAKSCDELVIIPIDINEHNTFINEEINILKKLLL